MGEYFILWNFSCKVIVGHKSQTTMRERPVLFTPQLESRVASVNELYIDFPPTLIGSLHLLIEDFGSIKINANGLISILNIMKIICAQIGWCCGIKSLYQVTFNIFLYFTCVSFENTVFTQSQNHEKTLRLLI